MSAGSKTPVAQFGIERKLLGMSSVYDSTFGSWLALIPTAGLIDPEANPPVFNEPDPIVTGYGRFHIAGTGNNPSDPNVGIVNVGGYQFPTFNADPGEIAYAAVCSTSTVGAHDAHLLDVLSDDVMSICFVDASVTPALFRAPGHTMQDDFVINFRVPIGGTQPSGLGTTKLDLYKVMGSDHGTDTFQIEHRDGTPVTITSNGTVLGVHVDLVPAGTFLANSAATVAAGDFSYRDT